MELKSTWENAFEAIYELYADKVYHTALTYSKDHYVAEEVLQNTFMTLYVNIDHVNSSKIEPWLKVTAKHMAINYVRDNSKEIPFEDVNYISQADKEIYFLKDEEILFCNIDKEERVNLIEEIYGELYRKNKRWYEALTITYILEKPQSEVAETMGISLVVLQSIIKRAKKWIRKRYKERFDDLRNA